MSLGLALNLLTSLVLPLVLLGVWVTWLVRRRRTSPPIPPVVGPAPQGTGRWYAQLTAPGAMLVRGGYGQLELTGGRLVFHPDDPGAAPWSITTAWIRAGRHHLLMTQELWLESPELGRVDLTVSREHINRFMSNDLKHLRERGYAQEFLAVLRAHGGTVL